MSTRSRPAPPSEALYLRSPLRRPCTPHRTQEVVNLGREIRGTTGPAVRERSGCREIRASTGPWPAGSRPGLRPAGLESSGSHVVHGFGRTRVAGSHVVLGVGRTPVAGSHVAHGSTGLRSPGSHVVLAADGPQVAGSQGVPAFARTAAGQQHQAPTTARTSTRHLDHPWRHTPIGHPARCALTRSPRPLGPPVCRPARSARRRAAGT